MSRQRFLLCLVTAASVLPGCRSRQYNQESADTATASGGTETKKCDIVIAGGSTAATAAAIAAAEEFKKHNLAGKKVCLFEPTDWPGGQLTASGVPAVDFDHHTKRTDHQTTFPYSQNVSTLATNNSTVFADWMSNLALPVKRTPPLLSSPVNGVFQMDQNPGRCWVSVRCYKPEDMAKKITDKLSSYKPFLEVYTETVIKSVKKSGNRITSVEAVHRVPQTFHARYGTILSNVIEDWYSRDDSSSYKKTIYNFEGTGAYPVFIDATEWGEMMVLSGAEFDQGVPGNETCGQAIVFPLALELAPEPKPLPDDYIRYIKPRVRLQNYSHSGGGGNWDMNWRYRRMAYGLTEEKIAELKEAGVSEEALKKVTAWNTPPAKGDITQINVGNGNDYTKGYLFPTKAKAREEIANWKGGVRKDVLDEAAIHSLGMFEFMHTSEHKVVIDGHEIVNNKHVIQSNAFGTTKGLSKVPYMRDTRRSVGVGDFRMEYEKHLVQKDLAEGQSPFPEKETVGIGVYAADIHPIEGCRMPQPSTNHPKPFYLSLRAHTNKSIDNMLVAGKLMAQDFLAASATRLHPIEFASGTAAGVAAVFMVQNQASTSTMLNGNGASMVRSRIAAGHGPVKWTFPAKVGNE